jgi:hypothetical protein
MKKLLFVVATCLFVLMLPDLNGPGKRMGIRQNAKAGKQKEGELDSTLVI